MADIRHVTDQFSVAPQLALEEFPALASEGFRHIINNPTTMANYFIRGRFSIGNRRCNLHIHNRFWDGMVEVCMLTHWWGKPTRDGIN